MPEEVRATLYNVFRVPLNVIVVVVLANLGPLLGARRKRIAVRCYCSVLQRHCGGKAAPRLSVTSCPILYSAACLLARPTLSVTCHTGAATCNVQRVLRAGSISDNSVFCICGFLLAAAGLLHHILKDMVWHHILKDLVFFLLPLLPMLTRVHAASRGARAFARRFCAPLLRGGVTLAACQVKEGVEAPVPAAAAAAGAGSGAGSGEHELAPLNTPDDRS